MGGSMQRGFIVAALLCVGSAQAGADAVTEAPAIPGKASLSRTVQANLSLMSGELNLHLSRLSMQMIDLNFDVNGRRARFRLGSDTQAYGLKLDSDIKFQGGYARVRTTISLKVAGERYSYTLPEIDYVPSSLDGDYMIRWPIFKGTF